MAVKKKSTKSQESCVPPFSNLGERNDYGLLCSDGVEYKYHEDGTINWRKMVKTEYLVPNKQRTKETDISTLDDKDLLILLGGIKELAQIRGFTSVNYSVVSPSSDYVVATCSIKWIPNYETEGKEIEFSAIGDAAPHNTTNFARNYLGPIAENRAFVRCVRNFLKINVVASDEICMGSPAASASSESFDPSDPVSLLSKVMNAKSVTFGALKNKLIKEGFDGADSIESLKDIPGPKIFELLQRLQNKK
tara:strand:- start:617 stop:1363 length:747 start_codon:yes stop_codon:yes gene_type:complete